jgi:hypothetical protein
MDTFCISVVLVHERQFKLGSPLPSGHHDLYHRLLAAVRRLACEASDSGLLNPDLAAGIRRVRGVGLILATSNSGPCAQIAGAATVHRNMITEASRTGSVHRIG